MKQTTLKMLFLLEKQGTKNNAFDKKIFSAIQTANDPYGARFKYFSVR